MLVPGHHGQDPGGKRAGSCVPFPYAEQHVCNSPRGSHQGLHLKRQLEQLPRVSAHIPCPPAFPKPSGAGSTGGKDSPTASLHPCNPPSAQVRRPLRWSPAGRADGDQQRRLPAPAALPPPAAPRAALALPARRRPLVPHQQPLPWVTASALLLPGGMRGLTEWGFIGRDLPPPPGTSPVAAASLVARGAPRCALPLPPAPRGPAPVGHCVLPNSPNSS